MKLKPLVKIWFQFFFMHNHKPARERHLRQISMPADKFRITVERGENVFVVYRGSSELSGPEANGYSAAT
jgi:hypothetical protein